MADDQEKVAPPPKESEFQRLKRENEALKHQLAQKQAEKGPPVGMDVCFRRKGEDFCRPGKIVSDGFTELLKAPGGAVARHALIDYGEPPWTIGSGVPDHMKGHSFQTDRPHHPLGLPDTWHLPGECPLERGAGCPYSSDPHWPARRAANADVQAP